MSYVLMLSHTYGSDSGRTFWSRDTRSVHGERHWTERNWHTPTVYQEVRVRRTWHTSHCTYSSVMPQILRF